MNQSHFQMPAIPLCIVGFIIFTALLTQPARGQAGNGVYTDGTIAVNRGASLKAFGLIRQPAEVGHRYPEGIGVRGILREWDRNRFGEGTHSGWVMAVELNDATLHLNTASVSDDHHSRYVWLVGKYEVPPTDGEKQNYDTQVFDAFIDCDGRRMMTLTSQYLLNNRVVPVAQDDHVRMAFVHNRSADRGSWEGLQRHGTGAAIHGLACR